MQAARTPLTPLGGETLKTDLLTVRETCDKLRISTWLFYKLVQRQEIKSIKIGRRRFVSVAALKEFIRQRSEDIG